jgi:hypothetical protein
MTRDMSESLTRTAQEAFENGCIVVELEGGVYWLVRSPLEPVNHVGRRTLRAIMPQSAPIRDIVKEIKRIASEY